MPNVLQLVSLKMNGAVSNAQGIQTKRTRSSQSIVRQLEVLAGSPRIPRSVSGSGVRRSLRIVRQGETNASVLPNAIINTGTGDIGKA